MLDQLNRGPQPNDERAAEKRRREPGLTVRPVTLRLLQVIANVTQPRVTRPTVPLSPRCTRRACRLERPLRDLLLTRLRRLGSGSVLKLNHHGIGRILLRMRRYCAATAMVTVLEVTPPILRITGTASPAGVPIGTWTFT